MAAKKSKAKKPTETMRQKQMRLRREAAAAKAKAAAKPKSGSTMVNRNKPTMRKLAAKAAQARKRGQGGRPLVRKSELDKANKPSIKKGASALRGRANAPKNLANMTSKLKAARAGRSLRKAVGRGGLTTLALSAANAIQDRLLSPAALKRKRANEIRPLTKADMPSLPKGSGSRRGQGSSKPAAKRGKKPMANLPKDYKKTEAAAFKGARKPKPSGGSSTTTSRRAAAPAATRKAAAPKVTPKKVTKKVSGVGPVKSGRSYSVQKTGKSVMQQQAAELRKMREASKKRQAADKAKSKKKKR